MNKYICLYLISLNFCYFFIFSKIETHTFLDFLLTKIEIYRTIESSEKLQEGDKPLLNLKGDQLWN